MDTTIPSPVLAQADLVYSIGITAGVVIGLLIVALVQPRQQSLPAPCVVFAFFSAIYIGLATAEILAHTSLNLLPNTCEATMELMGPISGPIGIRS